MTLVPTSTLEPGDVIQMPKCEPVVVEDVLALEDGRLRVHWWRASDPAETKQRRWLWKHRTDADGRPFRLSFAALQLINEAIDGRELGSLVPFEPEQPVRLVARERRSP